MIFRGESVHNYQRGIKRLTDKIYIATVMFENWWVLIYKSNNNSLGAREQ